MIKPGEIVFCNVTLKTAKDKSVLVRETIMAREYDKELQMKFTMEKDGGYLKSRFKLSMDAEITKIDVIRSMGYKVKHSESSLAIPAAEKNERQANGTY